MFCVYFFNRRKQLYKKKLYLKVKKKSKFCSAAPHIYTTILFAALQSCQMYRYLPRISNRWRATAKLKITKYEKSVANPIKFMLNMSKKIFAKILLIKYINISYINYMEFFWTFWGKIIINVFDLQIILNFFIKNCLWV